MIATVIAGTVCLVLLAVVADLILRSGPADSLSRSGAYVSLGSIGLALAVGLARYLTGSSGDELDSDDDELDPGD